MGVLESGCDGDDGGGGMKGLKMLRFKRRGGGLRFDETCSDRICFTIPIKPIEPPGTSDDISEPRGGEKPGAYNTIPPGYTAYFLSANSQAVQGS